MSVARLADGGSFVLPPGGYVHVFVVVGAVTVEGAGVLGEGDAARVRGADGQRVTAVGPAEVIVWEMQAELGR
jgi:hypothetical protein